MADGEQSAAEIRAFLIADVRGYTSFTQERGDEAAARLTALFGEIVRAEVESRGGTLVDLRGDEALVAFASPRQALRAAVELQRRFVDETLADPGLALPVGIGLDAGEAVPVDGGFRGGALNLAARLCSLAAPGEVLASRELVHLARALDGVRYDERRPTALKGLPHPVHYVRVSGSPDPAEQLAPVLAERARARAARTARRRGRLLAAGGAVVLAVTAAIALPLALRGGGGESRVGLAGLPPNSVGLLDPDRGVLLAAVELPSAPGEIAVTDEDVWVTLPDDNRVVRIDPRTRTIADTIPLRAQPSGIAATESAVWVVEQGGPSLERIDPAAGRVVDSVRVGNGPAGVAVAGGSVWVANRLDDTVQRFDDVSGKLKRTATVGVGSEPVAIVAGAGALWVACSEEGAVYRVDPATASIEAVPVGGSGLSSVAFVGGKLWVANALDGTVSVVDPAASAVTHTVPVGRSPSGIASVRRGVWAASELDAALVKVDSSTWTVDDKVPLGTEPHALAAGGSGVWVAVRGTASSHRGGTLRVAYASAEFSIDPGYAYTIDSWPILALTSDGLVDFKRVGGSEGSTLVPNLAVRLPRPVDGGRTYTFQLQPGIRYSDGHRLLASDFRRALERSIGAGAPPFRAYADGVPGCTFAGRCDLSRSIVTNNAAGTITFHLGKPDPEFLDLLALPFAYPVPPGTPAHDTQLTPIPGTGPYRIERFDGKQLKLVRNPYFRPWSPAAQPDGNVDTIVIRYRADSGEDELRDVERGDQDLTTAVSPSPAQLATLTTTFAGRLHPQPLADLYYFALNTRVPPFDDVRVRQAFNYAIDRDAVVEAVGGRLVAHATCQVLPPNFEGYDHYCPYTQDPTESGRWRSPDLAKARALVRASQTAGMPVTIWASYQGGGPHAKTVAAEAVSALRKLGYRASLHFVEDLNKYITQTATSSSQPRAALRGWSQDYPTASSFIAPQLTCKAFALHDPLNYNVAEFCDRKIDALIEQARTLEATDQVAKRKLWARIDRALVDQAPYVPLWNTIALDVLSARAGNYQRHILWGVLLDRMWVQ